jgi:uncharacterized protein (DUF305 family)
VVYRNTKTTFSFTILFSFFLVITAIGCKSTQNVKANRSTVDQSELEALYWERIRNSREFTEADVHFMTGMIAHHAQAVLISRLAPQNGASEQVQTLAARIINAQKGEIKTMQRWLRDRGQPVPKVHIEGLNLMIHGMGGHHSSHKNMRGMLSQDQIEKLADARGAEFDRLFLTYMIDHHKGAVTMVKKLFSTDGAAQDVQAYHLASAIQVDQKTEIARMNRMLDDLAESN